MQMKKSATPEFPLGDITLIVFSLMYFVYGIFLIYNLEMTYLFDFREFALV